MPQIAEPLTYLDRKGLGANARYVFVSYSHHSKDNVYACLNELYDKGLNYWYDKELLLGDNWLERVEKCLADERCCGVIFFFDENSLKGNAIEKEIKLYEHYKDIKPNLFSFCVVPAEAGSVYCVVRNVLASMTSLNETELQAKLPESRVVTVLQNFHKDFLYQVQKGDFLTNIIQHVRSREPMAITDDVTSVNVLKSKLNCNEINGVLELTFGKFPQMRCQTEGLNFADNKIHLNSHGEEVYFCEEGTFKVQPITWALLDVDNDVATLVSKKVLATADGYPASVKAAISMLENGFSEKEREMLVGRAQLISTAQLDKLAGKIRQLEYTDYTRATSNGFISAVWLKDTVGAKRKLLCGLNLPDDCLDEHQDSVNGFMPCIQISLTK